MSDDFDNIKFDKLVQQKYAEHESAVPEHLWKNIDGATSQIKIATLSKRIFWYRWLTLSLVLTIFGVVIYYQTNSSENKNVIQITKNQTQTNELIIGTESEIIPNLESNKKNNKYKRPQKLTSIKERKSVETQQENLKQISKKRLISEKKEGVYFPNEIDSDNLKAKKETLNNELNELMVKGVGTIKKQNNSTTTEEKTITTVEEVEENSQLVNDKAIDFEITPINNETITSNKDKVVSQETILNNQINDSILPVISEVLGSLDNYEKDTILIDSTNVNDAITDTSLLVSEKNLSKINISLLFMPGLSTVGIKPKSNSNKIYNSAEENHFQFSAGFNLGYQISNKFSISVGVGYRKFNNEFKQDVASPNELPMLINPINNSVTINSSLGIILIDDVGSFNFAGDDEDDVFLDDEDDFADLNFKEEYSFVLLDLPLAINYEIGKEKLKLLVGGGLTTSIVINSKSKIEISNVYTPESPLIIENFHDTKKITLSGMVSVGLKYNLSNHISLLILPSYNKAIMNINNNNSSEIKPASMSFSTGIGYQF